MPSSEGSVCTLTGGVSPGNYSLEVSASGFNTLLVDAVVTRHQGGECGCTEDALQPAMVTLHAQ